MELTQEEVQEKINLTPKQKKAFDSFIRAVKRCKKENIYFYQVLESVGALNGNNVDSVDEEEYYFMMYPEKRRPSVDEEFDSTCLHNLDYPEINITCSWADDTHYVKLKETNKQ